MLVYVAHRYSNDKRNIEKARKITHDLAVADRANTYVCPLLCFSYLRYNEIGYEEEIAMCTDLLGECAKMIVASEISRGVQLEIDYCNEWGIPIEYYDYRRENKCRILHRLSRLWRRASCTRMALTFTCSALALSRKSKEAE